MEDRKDINYNNISRNKKKLNEFKVFAKSHIKYLFSGKPTINYVVGVVTASIIVLVTIFNIIAPDKDFSEKENRTLSQRPNLSLTAIAEGTFAEDMESYVTDQFVFRDLWIKLRSDSEVVLGKYNANGVYKGDYGYLFEDITTPDSEIMQKNLSAVNSFADTNAQTGIMTSMMIVPNAANILSEYLPAYAPVRNQNADMDTLISLLGENVKFQDLRAAFNEKKIDTQLYYRTDHHWTTDAAYIAFTQLAPTLGIDANAVSFSKYALTNDFTGTLASKSGFHVPDKDVIETYIPDTETEYVVEYVEEGEKTGSVYEPENLKKNDKYSVFFGGNYSEVRIRTTVNNTRRLLVFKDSYANCFIPFLLPYYKEIVMIDPRYYYEDINELMNEVCINQVLFLFNANTFFEEDTLESLLGTGEIQQ